MMKHIVKNVLTNKERKKLIKDCQPYLSSGKELSKRYGHDGRKYPGPTKQTLETIHHLPCFREPIHKILVTIANTLRQGIVLQRVWINCTNGKDVEDYWHNHLPMKWSCVYYMKTIPFVDSGTLFKDGFVRAPQNSLIIFPANLYHRPPSSPLRFKRYSMALDLTSGL